MNKNNIVEFKTKKSSGLFISVPYNYKNFKIVQYPTGGTYVMETDINGLNHWKTKIPKGNYEVIGLSNKIKPDLVESKIKMPFNDYIKILNKKDITVNYSDTSNFWLVVIST